MRGGRLKNTVLRAIIYEKRAVMRFVPCEKLRCNIAFRLPKNGGTGR